MGSGASSHSAPPKETEPAPDLSISPTSTPTTTTHPSSISSPTSPVPAQNVAAAVPNGTASNPPQRAEDPFAQSGMLQHTPRREQSLLDKPRAPREVGISPKFSTERIPRTGGGSLTLNPSPDKKNAATDGIDRSNHVVDETKGMMKDEKEDDRSSGDGAMVVVKEFPPIPGDPETGGTPRRRTKPGAKVVCPLELQKFINVRKKQNQPLFHKTLSQSLAMGTMVRCNTGMNEMRGVSVHHINFNIGIA